MPDEDRPKGRTETPRRGTALLEPDEATDDAISTDAAESRSRRSSRSASGVRSRGLRPSETTQGRSVGRPGRRAAFTISFVHRRVGVAKTTSAWNTAHELCRLGHKVLLVDADGQAELTRLAGLNSYQLTEGLGSILLGEIPIRAAIRESIGLPSDRRSAGTFPLAAAHSPSELDLLPSTHRLEDEVLPELIRCDARTDLLRWTLNSVRHQYDFVLIDGPQSMSLLNQNVVAASDLAIIPMATGFGVFAEDELQDIVSACLKLRPELAPDRLWILPTRHKRRSMAHQRTLRHLRERTPTYSRLLGPVHHSSWVETAMRNAQPIREVHRGLEATESYRLLAHELSRIIRNRSKESLEPLEDQGAADREDLWPRS